jgi:hypothetical protein
MVGPGDPLAFWDATAVDAGLETMTGVRPAATITAPARVGVGVAAEADVEAAPVTALVGLAAADGVVVAGAPWVDEAAPLESVDREFFVDAERRVDPVEDRGADPWCEAGIVEGGPVGFDVEWLVGADPAPGSAAAGATDGAAPAPNVQASAPPACGW